MKRASGKPITMFNKIGILICMMMMQQRIEVNAWGGLFNRFTPEMLSNLGYGGHSGGYRPSYMQVLHFSFYLLPSIIDYTFF